MKLATLIDLVYRRGCNSTAEAAQATARFRELEDQLGDSEAALFAHLGESLIEAGAVCLPPTLVDLAQDWPERAPESQLIILEQVYRTLQVWGPKRSLRARRSRQQAAQVLPFEHGPWGTGAYQPSCMGVGTLLMAFAKLCGARHYFAHVICPTDAEVLRNQFMLVQEYLGFLSTTLPGPAKDPKFAGRMRKWLSAAIYDMRRTENYDFHPALVIQLSDLRWVLVDPYLGVRAVLDDDSWGFQCIATRLEGESYRSVITVHNGGELIRRRQDHNNQLQFCMLLAQRILHMVEHAELEPSPIVIELFVREVVQLGALRSIGCFIADASEHYISVCGLFDHVPKRVTHKKVESAIQQIENDPVYRQLAFERSVGAVFKLWFNAMLDDNELLIRRTAHPTLELTRPSIGVAAGVLNNVRCWLKPKPVRLGGALLRHSRSQTIWHDSRLELRNRARLDPELGAVLAEYESKLSEASSRMLHPRVQRLLQVIQREEKEQAHANVTAGSRGGHPGLAQS